MRSAPDTGTSIAPTLALPDFVATACTPADHVAGPSIELPARLRRASGRRQQEFLAGRACAAAAIAQLGAFDITVGMDAGGAPVWPAGLVGSITHTGGFAWAAAALSRHAAGIGIDAERFMSGARAARVARRLASASEITHAVAASSLDQTAALTLIFSAKEAFYKCVYPQAGVVFDYLDARVDGIDAGAGCITVVLTTTVTGAWRAGAGLDGRFEIRDGMVRTAFVCLRGAAA